jgi:NADH:ubiquinone oxidoreductase subunit 2 (subunit N)
MRSEVQILISNKHYVLVVAILFEIAVAINCFRRVIKLIGEPAGEKQSEQKQTSWTQK